LLRALVYNQIPVKRSIISLLFCVIIAAFLPSESLRAQGTAFTYQGRLNDGGAPANGGYDLTFALFNTNVTGTALTGALTNNGTTVSNGLFTVTLDFSNRFDGTPRWLEIGVRTNGASGFTTLSPRQPLTPTPYAIFANTASNLSGTLPAAQLAGTLPPSAFAGYTNTVALTNGGNLFAGMFSGIFSGSFFGNGGGVTNVNVTNLTGVLANNQLPANTAFVNSNQTFSGANIFTNFNNSFQGSFFGNGLVGWIATNGTAIQAVIDHGYLLTSPQLVTVTLPASANSADIVRISGAGASGWKVAQNAGQSIIGNFSSFANSPWTMTLSANNWNCIASSADGSRLAAVANVNGIFTSINSGITWNPNTVTSAQFRSIASSADGSKLVAAVFGGGVYTNSGTSWTIVNATAPSSANWTSVASSANGSVLYAAVNGSSVYSSVNSGATWTTVTGGGSWVSVACSADGSKFAAAQNGGIQASGGSGAPNANWVSVTSSADGNRLAAAIGGGSIYTSSNGGASWTQQAGAPSANWTSIASSADGSKLAAVVNGGGIYISSNYGITWVQQTNAPVRSWNSIASSADGTKLAAVVNNTTTGGIFVSQASQQTTTTVGTGGYLIGSQGSAVELQYIGNNQFMPVSFAGNLWAY
jgi:hypothetical protein